jgi:hypothetical protein
MSRSRKGFLPVLAGRSRIGVCRVFLCAALALPGIRPDTPTPDTPTEDEPVTPVVVVDDLDPAKVELGRKLFLDPRVSGGNTCFPAPLAITLIGAVTTKIGAP